MVPLAARDFAYPRDTEKKLNAMLASQAHAGGARYVDTYPSTIGHDMGQPPGSDGSNHWFVRSRSRVPTPTPRGSRPWPPQWSVQSAGVCTTADGFGLTRP
jgi:hypothetical protein